MRPTAGTHLRGGNIALAVDGQVVHPLERASHPPWTTERAELRPGLPIERVDLHVRSVGDKDVALRFDFRQDEIPYRTVLQCLWLNLKFLHERAVGLKNLNAIVGSVAHVDQTVVG